MANNPPTEFIWVMPDKLRSFVAEAFQAVGTKPEDAAFLAELLVLTDLRGVFSHGTRQLSGYLQMIIDGKVNPQPNVTLENEALATVVVDGDGGLGHFAAYRAARAAVEKAKETGLGAAVSRNHFHIGGAGKYSRLAIEEGCVGFVVSAHRFKHQPGQSVLEAPHASPMSFAIPSGQEAPIVLDMANGVESTESPEKAFERIPATFFKTIGLGAVCHALGGFMAGIWLFDRPPEPGLWEGANQGAFVMAIDVSRFTSTDDFTRDMDQYVREVHGMKPAPGQDRALLPGELEYEREREWAGIGVPVGREHEESLSSVADLLGIPAPL